MKITGYDHIAIAVPDQEVAKEFYTKIGFKYVDTYGDIMVFRNGDVCIHLHPGSKRDVMRYATGYDHVCFTVPDLDKAVMELKLKGVQLNFMPTNEIRVAHFIDPFGIDLEIVEGL